MRLPRLFASLLGAAVLLAAAVPGRACVGSECLQIWSTAPGGGALVVQWRFDAPLVHLGAFCSSGQCQYTAIDPGFITSTDPPADGFHALADGTRVRVELMGLDAGASVSIDGTRLQAPGASALLGAAPTLHVHPQWRLLLPQGEQGEYALTFRLRSEAAAYADSPDYTVVLTTAPPPTMTAAPSATPTPTVSPAAACAGDCNGDGQVTIDELVRGVNLALSGAGVPCAALDVNGDGEIAINELIAGVNSALAGCPSAPTPTATRAASFAEIQQAIFAPRCAVAPCHDSQFASGDLVLEDEVAYAELVGVAPFIEAARDAGLLRVDPGNPENSLLLIKLVGPPLEYGSRMPLLGDPLSAEEIALIEAWIAAGAPE